VREAGLSTNGHLREISCHKQADMQLTEGLRGTASPAEAQHYNSVRKSSARD
jgi:hypothetical protein